MKNIKQEAQVWVQLITFISIWVALLYITRTELRINVEAFKKLPEVVTVYMILYFLFSRWGWRLSVFKNWLVPFPDLQGTWLGTLQTSWKDPATGETPAAIPLIIVIRQSFSSVSCVMYTRESTSHSNAAILVEEDSSGLKKLVYNYTNTPKAAIRERSAVHHGATLLRIIERPERMLEGEYWTDRGTRGDITVSFRSRDLAERFQT